MTGGGKGDGGTSINIEPQFTLTPSQLSLLESLSGALGMQFDPETGEILGVDFPDGPFVPGASPLQEQAFAAAAGFGEGEEADARRGAIQRILSGETSGAATPEAFLQFFEDSVAAPELRRFDRTTRQSIEHRFGSGGDSGVVADILARARADLGSGLAQTRGQLGIAGLNAQIGEERNALNALLPGAQASLRNEFAPGVIQGQLGGVQRQIAAQQGQEQFGLQVAEMGAFNPFLTQFLGPALGTSAFQNVAAPVGGGGGKGASGGDILGGLGSIATIAALF